MLYRVAVSRLNEQVKRNVGRFPDDLGFQLTRGEFETLRSQNAISRTERRGGRRWLPYAVTEHGAVMAASVLNSPKAVEMSVEVVRVFVRLRGFLASHHQLAAKLNELEREIATHDTHIVALFDAVRSLMAMPDKPKRQIGFQTKGRGLPPDRAEIGADGRQTHRLPTQASAAPRPRGHSSS